MLRKIILLMVTPFLAIFSWLLLVRIVRHFYKFPMPQFMANVIDNPLRRKVQPPDETAIRHGIEPGMAVLDIGPGNGTYTMAAAGRVGPSGKVIAVDIEPRMIERVQQNAAKAGLQNVEARLADVYNLPFDDETFDVITMITVLGEIPQPERALAECHRVLKPNGILADSELFLDPDYKKQSTLRREAEAAGFHHKETTGNFFVYAMQFSKN